MPKLKSKVRAFVVTSPDESNAKVVMAESASKARAACLGCDEFSDYGLLDLRAHRGAEFDKYAPKGPTTYDLVEKHEWWQGCQGCYRQVTLHEKGRKWKGKWTLYCGECVKRGKHK